MNALFGVDKYFQRFLIVGALSTALNYGTFLVCFVPLSISYMVAGIIGYVTGMLFGYVLNRTWAFESPHRWSLKEVTGYGVVYGGSLLLNTVVLAGSVELFNLSPLIGNICAIGTSTFSNYVGLRLYVFRRVTGQV